MLGRSGSPGHLLWVSDRQLQEELHLPERGGDLGGNVFERDMRERRLRLHRRLRQLRIRRLHGQLLRGAATLKR